MFNTCKINHFQLDIQCAENFHYKMVTIAFGSGFRNEKKNGIFVLGLGFSSDKFRFLTSHFDGIFLYHSKRFVV